MATKQVIPEKIKKQADEIVHRFNKNKIKNPYYFYTTHYRGPTCTWVDKQAIGSPQFVVRNTPVISTIGSLPYTSTGRKGMTRTSGFSLELVT
ncbi:MAG: hypothetical protein ACE5HI_01250 [bacterium]